MVAQVGDLVDQRRLAGIQVVDVDRHADDPGGPVGGRIGAVQGGAPPSLESAGVEKRIERLFALFESGAVIVGQRLGGAGGVDLVDLGAAQIMPAGTTKTGPETRFRAAKRGSAAAPNLVPPMTLSRSMRPLDWMARVANC